MAEHLYDLHKKALIEKTNLKQHIILGDSNHNWDTIIEFVSYVIPEMKVQHLFLEIPNEVEAEVLQHSKLADNNDALLLLSEWSSRPAQMAELIDTARDNNILVHFVDDAKSIKKVESFINKVNYPDNESSITNDMAKEAIKERLEVNSIVADRIKNKAGKEKSITLFGLGHHHGEYDLNEMIGADSITVDIFPSPDVRKEAIALSKIMLGNIQEADLSITLPNIPATLPMIKNSISRD